MNFFELQLKWSSKGEECPPIKREGTTVFGCHDKKKGKFLLFFSRGHFILPELFWVATQKSSSMSWEKLKFSLCPMNWTLTSFANSRKELNLVVNFKSTFNCYTALEITQLCIPGNLWEQRMSGLKIEAKQQRLGQLTANQSIFIRRQKDIRDNF